MSQEQIEALVFKGGMAIDQAILATEQMLVRQRTEAGVSERGYLRSLNWTDKQLAAFDRRVTGIHTRADRVLGLELCSHGTTYRACRRGCPPWRWPRSAP